MNPFIHVTPRVGFRRGFALFRANEDMKAFSRLNTITNSTHQIRGLSTGRSQTGIFNVYKFSLNDRREGIAKIASGNTVWKEMDRMLGSDHSIMKALHQRRCYSKERNKITDPIPQGTGNLADEEIVEKTKEFRALQAKLRHFQDYQTEIDKMYASLKEIKKSSIHNRHKKNFGDRLFDIYIFVPVMVVGLGLALLSFMVGAAVAVLCITPEKATAIIHEAVFDVQLTRLREGIRLRKAARLREEAKKAKEAALGGTQQVSSNLVENKRAE